MSLLHNTILRYETLPEFQRAVEGAIFCYRPTQAYLIRIDEWFGPKWLGFAGKVLGALGVGHAVEMARVPPFHPHRVIAASSFERSEPEGNWTESGLAPLHPFQTSETNTRRQFVDIAGPDAIAVWFGGDGRNRHCAMVYSTIEGECSGWYAEIDIMTPGRVLHGISTREYESLLAQTV